MVVIGGDNKKLFHLAVGEKKQIVIKTLGNNKMLFHLTVGYHFYTTPPCRAPLLRGGELGGCGGGWLRLLLPSFKGGVPR